MTTNSQVIGRLLRSLDPDNRSAGAPLGEFEIQQIERAFEDFDRSADQIKGWAGNGPNSPVFDKLKVQELFSEMSVGHIVSYTRSGALSIANATEVTVTWNGGKRGQGANPETFACMLAVGGDYSKFTYAAWVEKERSLIVFGDFSFEGNAAGERTLYINTFDADGNPGGATTFNVDAAPSDITTITFMYHLTLDKGHYITVSLWQDSGTTLTMDQGNLSFMLA